MNGSLFVKACMRDGKTILKESYFSPPFKLANITDRNDGEMLNLVIMSSSPGILDKDDLAVTVILDEGASVKLATQSFQRLFQMNAGAGQRTELVLASNSTLRYLPFPCVPHERAIFTSSTIVRLQPGSRLIYGEVITCGRSLNGEQFKFTHFENRTSIFYSERLVLKELVRMTPAVSNHLAMGLLEGFTHQASMICITEAEIQQRAVEFVSQQAGVEWGISAIPAHGILVKLLGSSAYTLHALLEGLADVVETSRAICSSRQVN